MIHLFEYLNSLSANLVRAADRQFNLRASLRLFAKLGRHAVQSLRQTICLYHLPHF